MNIDKKIKISGTLALISFVIIAIGLGAQDIKLISKITSQTITAIGLIGLLLSVILYSRFCRKKELELEQEHNNKLQTQIKLNKVFLQAKPPYELLNAFATAKYFFVTTKGTLIPLLLVKHIKCVGASENTTFDINAWDGNTRSYYAEQPKGSIAVKLVGNDEIIIEPIDLPAFTNAIKSLKN
jgi:hypothetical protein